MFTQEVGRGAMLARSTILAAVLLAGCLGGQARGAGVQVRWLPTVDARVVGYHVYVRPAGKPYGPPLDARLPARRPDGSMALVVSGLASGATYFVGVTSYTADRSESRFSREMMLGEINPCVADSCSGPSSCQIETLTDGTPCDVRYLCSACRAAVCGGGPTLEVPQRKVRLAAGPNRSRLAAKGAFVSPPDFMPQVTGMTLTFADPVTGVLLYEAGVPGGQLQGKLGGNVFWFTDKGQDTPGRLRIRIILAGDMTHVSLRATTADLRSFLPLSRIAMTVRLGANECASQLDLPCAGYGAATVCR